VTRHCVVESDRKVQPVTHGEDAVRAFISHSSTDISVARQIPSKSERQVQFRSLTADTAGDVFVKADAWSQIAGNACRR
jgi:hypothetical protein